jgi:nitrate reductase molybdenum cofactor assembly chaperone NarJ/NarW
MISYEILARLMEYPADDSFAQLDHYLGEGLDEQSREIAQFAEQARALGLRRLQEIYIELFDLHAETSPYIGHHLFGEDIRRSLFMAKLREQYREVGIADSIELPDHLAEILRYLAALDGDLSAEDEELIERCVLPAVQHMRRAIESGNAVYKHLVSAILLELRQLENFKVAAE